MNFPTDVKYTKTDEWIRVKGNEAEVGLTDYAQNHLSDIVYVELPEVGAEFKQATAFGSIESVKAASDLNLPVSGKISAVNDSLADTPEVVNSDPFGKGWIVKCSVANAAELSGLMDAAAYQKYCEERG
ncbi:MAG TPA: glycine cleavage system protein GcvH [Anaerolineae bacterium]|nr:glycine cleavage system protein GcvH [Anaerolineae bacterium]